MLSVMNKCFAISLIALNIASFNVLPIQAQNMVVETEECVKAITSGENQLRAVRQLTLELSEIDNGNVSGTPPEGRPNQHAFGLKGEKASSVLSSPVLMNTIATRIIDNCNSISSVSFGVWQTGWLVVYGLIENEGVKIFKCPEDYNYDPETDRDLIWGEFCPY